MRRSASCASGSAPEPQFSSPSTSIFLDAAYAPGTGTPEIGGFTTHEALKLILGVCPGQRLVGMDLVEVLPGYRLRGHHLVRRGGDHARVSGLPRRQQEA